MKQPVTCTNLWNDLYITSGIPFWVFDTAGTEQYAFPDTLEHNLLPEIFDFSLQELEKHNIRDEVLVYYLNDYYYFIICRLDESLCMMSVPLTSDQHVQLPIHFLHHFVVSEHKSAFLTLLAGTPTKKVYQGSQFANLVKNVYCGRNVGEIRGHRIKQMDQASDTIDNRNTAAFSEILPSEAQMHQSLFFEEDVAPAIERGDDLDFVRKYSRPMNIEFGRMSSDALRQRRYLFILLMYAISHAAIRGGMDSEEALRLSDVYCMRMDEMHSVLEISELSIMAGKEYCQKVREAKKIPPLSPEVKICCDYIYSHLYETIRLPQLEAAAHMNRRSLTIHFKEELGETIPQFVTRKKLEEAVYLMKTSDFGTLQISSLLGFSSQSHFIEQFKKQYGMTPRQYMRK